MLISYLAKQTFVLPFTGIETLLRDSDYMITMLPESAQMNDFKLSNQPMWKKAWEERIEPVYSSYVDFMKDRKYLKMLIFFKSISTGPYIIVVFF